MGRAGLGKNPWNVAFISDFNDRRTHPLVHVNTVTVHHSKPLQIYLVNSLCLKKLLLPAFAHFSFEVLADSQLLLQLT